MSPPKLGRVAVRSRKAAPATSARTDGVVPNLRRKEKANSETLRLCELPRLLALRRAQNFLWVAANPPNLEADTLSRNISGTKP
jgi:hypothetical protein